MALNTIAHWIPSRLFCSDDACDCHVAQRVEPILQDFRLGFMTWQEMLNIAHGKTLWSGERVHYLFADASDRARAFLAAQSVPFYEGATTGVEVGFPASVIVHAVVDMHEGRTSTYLYEWEGHRLRYVLDTGILDTIEDVPVQHVA